MTIGRKIRKVMSNPVITGVVRIWILSSNGPSVGIVELCDEVDEGVEDRVADDEAEAEVDEEE